MVKRLLLASLLALSASTCTDQRSHTQAVYMLVDTSGTYAQEVGKAQIIINYLLGTLQPGDSLVVFSDGLLDLRPDLATKEVQLPSDARRAATAQEMVDILAHGARDKELFDDVTVLALKRL